MSDINRLRKLIAESHLCVDSCSLADHLIASGVIVPPCKIGDKIYMVVTRKTVRFDFCKGGMRRVNNKHSFIKQSYLTKLNFFKVIEDFGKTVFLTREDAEKALKEMQNNGH